METIKPVAIPENDKHEKLRQMLAEAKARGPKMYNCSGFEMTGLEKMKFDMYLTRIDVPAMNTLFPKERTEVTRKWLEEHRQGTCITTID